MRHQHAALTSLPRARVRPPLQVKLRVRADAKATSKAAALAGAELPAKPGEPESPDRDQQ